MGTLIQFVPKLNNYEVWPCDWVDEYEPTMYEVTATLNTITNYENLLTRELSNAGVSAEFEIRHGLDQLHKMRGMILVYLSRD